MREGKHDRVADGRGGATGGAVGLPVLLIGLFIYLELKFVCAIEFPVAVILSTTRFKSSQPAF